MAYEIPQNLQYKEKIIFGLTFNQIGWIALFGGVALIIWLKAPFFFELKVTLCLIFLLTGGAFAFLNAYQLINTVLSYALSFQTAGYGSKKLESFFRIKTIENNQLVLDNGDIRGVLLVQPFNFTLLSIEEKTAILTAYGEFLNSLDFPIQIVIRTVDLNLEPYFNKLKKQDKVALSQQASHLETFVTDYLKDKKAANRLFYIVVPVSQQEFKTVPAKTKFWAMEESLSNRCQLVLDRLKKCNVLGRRLTDSELLEVFGGYFEVFPKELKVNPIDLPIVPFSKSQ